jgi:hypothetical protein
MMTAKMSGKRESSAGAPACPRVPQSRRSLVLLMALLLFAPAAVLAGPPYVTDDPEPVEYRHWEVYLASQLSHDVDSWSGTAPHIEANYGAFPNFQLHVIAPLAFVRPAWRSTQYGYADTELGGKWRFIQETSWRPQVGTFPLLELPTGDRERGLGSGHARVFLPLWLQKSIGPWTTYGGGGYWVNPGAGNRNWWFAGWQVQCQLLTNVTPGVEIFHTTAQEEGGTAETRFNVGLVFDFSDLHHLLLSTGRGLQGPNRAQVYLAYLLTFGPGP